MATTIRDRQLPNQTHRGLYDPVEMVTVVAGFTSVLLGLMGLFDPGFMGLQLSPMHCFVLGSTGALAVWGGLTSGEHRVRARRISLTLGLFFLANLVLGVMIQEAVKDRSVFNEEMVRTFAPGFLELESWDHFLHGALAVVYLLDYFLIRRKHSNPSSEANGL